MYKYIVKNEKYLGYAILRKRCNKDNYIEVYDDTLIEYIQNHPFSYFDENGEIKQDEEAFEKWLLNSTKTL